MNEAIETKAFNFDIKAVAEDGQFSGYASTWGVDLGGDQILRGAFAASIKESKGIIPILWQHDTKQPIGWNTSAEEDENGLLIKGELLPTDPLAQKAREFMQMALRVGARVGLSIGYRVVESAPGAKGVRLLTTLQLVEYSVVTFPMNTEATVTAVKAVVPYQDLPLADESRGWDAGAARGRVKAWAGGSDAIDFAKFSQAFLWHDRNAPEDFASYKFPIADAVNGKLVAVPRAIYAAAVAIASDGPSISKPDLAAVKSNLVRYYTKLKKDSPFGGKPHMEFKAEDFTSSLAEAQAMSDLYDERWSMEAALRDACNDVCEDTTLSLDEKKTAIATNFQQYGVAMAAWWSKFLDLTADDPEAADEDLKAKEAKELKAGRTLSAPTIDRMKEAIGMHAKAIDLNRDAMKMHRKGIGQMHSLMTYAGQYQADRNAPNPAGKPKSAPPVDPAPSALPAIETSDLVRSLNETIRKTRDALRAA